MPVLLEINNSNDMHNSLLVFLVLISSIALAQNTDFPDYRSKRELFSRITEKDIKSDIASFSIGGIDESIGKLPLKTLPISAVTDTSIIFGEGTMQVKIIAVAFDVTKHKLGYYDKKYLVRIDNKPFFGDYGKVPKTTVRTVQLIIDRDTILIPAEACADLANPVFSFKDKGIQKSQNKVYLSADGRRIYVYMLKPEKGGSYEVTWVIQDKKYVKRVVDFGFLKE